MIRPMLAAGCPKGMTQDEYLAQVRFPKLASPKIDGIRCLMAPTALSRNGLPIPNEHVRKLLKDTMPEQTDGELTAGDRFHDTSSAIMSYGGFPEFQYHIFDFGFMMMPESPYGTRLNALYQLQAVLPPFCRVLPQTRVENLEQLRLLEEQAVLQGYEGLILRDPDAPYKFGRSTLRQQWMLKVKRFIDGEARIIAIEELYHNENPATVSELGYLERSTHAEGMTGAGTMGRLLVEAINDAGPVRRGARFRVGSGFDTAMRKEIWDAQLDYIGRIITYKFQPHGVKDLPRLPIFRGFRWDLR